MSNTMTADEARAHMAQGGMVKDNDGDKCKIINDEVYYRRKGDMHWYLHDEFTTYAPFTPYTKTTKRELRQRAEAAEARVKELEADIIAARRHYQDRVVEETHPLQSQLAALAAERDALLAERAQGEARKEEG